MSDVSFIEDIFFAFPKSLTLVVASVIVEVVNLFYFKMNYSI